MAKDDDILRDAIIGTEKEIASAAWGEEDPGPLDPTGDRSLEEMGDGLEGQHEPEDEEEDDAPAPDDSTDEDVPPSEQPENPDAVEDKVKTEAKPDAQQETQGRIPAGRLREEAEAKRAAIAERDALKAQLAEKDASYAQLNAKLDGVIAAMQKGQQPQLNPAPQQSEEPKIPDLFEDPKGWSEYIAKQQDKKFEGFLKQQRDREVNASIMSARERHGQVFQDAWKALESQPKSPETVELVRRLEASPNPGDAIVSWHKRNQALRTVGEDLDAYNARIAEETRNKLRADPEFRKELLASLRGDAEIGDQGRPRTTVRLPGSLARASGNNVRAPADGLASDGSEQGIAASAWRD